MRTSQLHQFATVPGWYSLRTPSGLIPSPSITARLLRFCGCWSGASHPVQNPLPAFDGHLRTDGSGDQTRSRLRLKVKPSVHRPVARLQYGTGHDFELKVRTLAQCRFTNHMSAIIEPGKLSSLNYDLLNSPIAHVKVTFHLVRFKAALRATILIRN